MWMILSLVGLQLEEVRKIRRQRKELLSRGHFPIRKWCLNESSALEGKPNHNKEQLIKFHDGTDIAKALELAWDHLLITSYLISPKFRLIVELPNGLHCQQ